MTLFKARAAYSFIAGRSQAFDAGRGADGKVRADVYDRFTSTGEKIKDGRLSVFDQATLTQMARNWLARGDKLAMCFNHQSAYVQQNGQPAPALAFYDALCVVIGGEIVHVAKLPDSRADSVPFESTARGDGLYGFRCEVTELGQQLLPNFKYISPMFTDEGRDEQGNEIGYVLFDVAATNTPFQAGCEITFAQGARRAQGDNAMAKLSQLSKFVKFEEGADDKAIRQAVLSKMEEEAIKSMEEGYNYEEAAARLEEMAKAYEDAHFEEEEEGDAPQVTMRRYASKFRRMAKMAADGDGDEDDKMNRFGDAGDPDSDKKKGEHGQEPGSVSEKKSAGFEAEEKAKMEAYSAVARRLGISVPRGASSQTLLDAITAATVSTAEIPKMVGDLVKRELDAKERARLQLETKQRAAHLMASLRSDTPKEKREALARLSSDPQTFDTAIALAEPYLRPDAGSASQLFSRMTGAGAPLGVDPRPQTTGSGKDRKVVPSKIGVTFVEDGGEFSRMAIDMAREKDTDTAREIDSLLNEEERKSDGPRLYAANIVLKRRRPDLWKAAEEQYDF